MQTSWKKVLVLPACGAYFHAKFAILRIKYERWEKQFRSKYWYQCCQFCLHYQIMDKKKISILEKAAFWALDYLTLDHIISSFSYINVKLGNTEQWNTLEGILFESNRLPCAIISRRLQTSFNNLGEGFNLIPSKWKMIARK